MNIDRVRLENFGIIAEPIELEFGRGLNVVFGPNEVGKTTLRRAMWVGLTWPPSSQASEVKRLEPRRGGTPHIEMHLSRDGLELTVEKTFKQTGETRLVVEEGGTPEELSGDPAHQRLLEELGFGGPGGRTNTPEHEGLWPLTWVEQNADHEDPGGLLDAPGSDELTELLREEGARTETRQREGVFGEVEDKYREYYTATGKEREAESSPLHQAKQKRNEANKKVEELEDDREKYLEDVEAYQEAQRDLDEIGEAIGRLEKELEDAERRSDRVDELEGERDDLERALERLEDREEYRSERLEAQDDRLDSIDTLKKEVEDLEQDLEDARAKLEKAEEDVSDVEEHEEELEERVAALQEECDALRARVGLLEAREELDSLEKALEEAKESREELEEVRAESEAIEVDREALEELRELDGEIDAKRRELRAMAAGVEIEALETVEIEEGGERTELESGDVEERYLDEPTAFEIGDVARVRVDPGGGDDIGELADELEELQGDYESKLEEFGVESLESAREAVNRRESLEEHENELQHDIEIATDGEGIEALRTDIASWESKEESAESTLEEAPEDLELPDDRSECESRADDLDEEIEELQDTLEEVREDAKVARNSRRERRNRVEKLENDIENRRERLEDEQDRRDEFREEHGTVEELEEALEELREEMGAIEEEIEEIDDSLDELGAEQVEEEVERLEESIESHEERRRELRERRAELRSRLESDESIDLKRRLEEARRELRDREEELRRERERAEARKLLHDTFCEVRDELQARVRQPLREEVTRLAGRILEFDEESGAVMFDNDFEVDAVYREDRGADDFEELSFGSREQMGLLVRLAVARLIADDEPMPLVLDDVLTSSDRERFDAVADVLRQTAKDVQIIAATCHEQRFRRVGDANYIDLEQVRREARRR